MKKKFYLKLTIFLLVVSNYIVLALLYCGWYWDNEYGCGYVVRNNFIENAESGRNALAQLYETALFDIYYFAGFTSVLAICLGIVASMDSNEKKD